MKKIFQTAVFTLLVAMTGHAGITVNCSDQFGNLRMSKVDDAPRWYWEGKELDENRTAHFSKKNVRVAGDEHNGFYLAEAILMGEGIEQVKRLVFCQKLDTNQSKLALPIASNKFQPAEFNVNTYCSDATGSIRREHNGLWLVDNIAISQTDRVMRNQNFNFENDGSTIYEIIITDAEGGQTVPRYVFCR
jgi:hypothetical protein